jgi:hypothetical protein
MQVQVCLITPLLTNNPVKGLNTAFAVADGDIVGGVVSQFGGDLTEKALNSVGLNKDVLDGFNINQDDLVKGMLTTEKELT